MHGENVWLTPWSPSKTPEIGRQLSARCGDSSPRLKPARRSQPLHASERLPLRR